MIHATDCPDAPSEPLEERIPAPLREAMRLQGFEQLTAVQRAVLESNPEGQDLLISSQTGSGKTVALGLSMAEELIAPAAEGSADPSVLVITPTRELASQVQRELGWLYAGVRGVHVTVCTGGTSVPGERRQLRRGPRIVVGTPGRLLDHIKSGALDCGSLGTVVLDEADQMLDMGFRDELEGILEHAPAERRTHLVSATFPAAIRKLAERYQREPLHVQGTRLGDANRDIEHIACLVGEKDRYGALVNLLLLTGDKRVLVFVNTRAAAGDIAQALQGDGFSALPLSGELVQAQRTRTLESFRSGAVKVLVATDVAARGLDIPEVALVIHAGQPEDAEAYVHRSGRTGRAGKAGRCVTLATPRSRRFVERLMREAQVEVEWREVPTADTVRDELAARERERVASLIDDLEGVGTEHLELADELLAERDPRAVVARLLAAVRTRGVREPVEVQPPHLRRFEEKRREERSGPRGDFKKGGHQKGGFAKRSRGPSRGDFVRFEVNLGFKRGATPARLVAMLCRRGKIQGKAIGAIDIQAGRSTFEIARGSAREFEALTSRRDKRDPQTRIRRA